MTLARALKSLVLSLLVSMMMMMILVSVPTHSQEDQCPIEQGYEPVAIKPDADLIIALMLELHDAGGIDADECNFTEPANPGREQAKLVAEAAINNWPNSIVVGPGITFGLEIYDTCSSLDVGRFGASRYVNRRYENLYSNTTAACTNSSLRLGVVGFETSSLSGPLSMVLQPLDIPVIDFTSTADGLSDTTKYPNFFRTVPPDHDTVQVLTAVMKSFDWTYSKMVHNGNEFGLSGERALTAAYQAEGFCLSESIVINRRETRDEAYDDIVNRCLQQNIKVVILWTSSFNVIRIFKAINRIGGAAHDIQLVTTDGILYVPFTDLSDGEKAAAQGLIAVSPFVKREVYKTWLAQFHPGVDFTFLPSGLLIDSIHSYLQAFSLAQFEKCGDLSATCDALASIQGSEFIQYLKRVNFTGVSGVTVAFNENGDPAQSFYEVLQYKSTVGADGYSLQMVGEWDATTGLTLNKAEMEFYGEIGLLAQPPISTCEEGSCTDPRCRGDFPKFVIEALFDLHGIGCDTLRENRFTQVQAALFAIDIINKDSSILPGFHLSMTVSDICGSAQNAGRVAFQKIKGWNFGGGFPRKSGETYLMGMLHSGSSGKAMEESRTLQIVDVPLLANSATSPALSDTEEFPNFLRTVPSDIKQTLVMAEILVSLGLMYVQVINSRGAYGEGGARAFGDAAKKNGVCITNSVTVDSNTNYGTLLSDLMAKPDARVLVLFVIDSDARGLFGEMVDRSVEPGYFQIIASDSWGIKAGFIPGMESVAVGALTVTFKSSAIPAFEEFFLTMNPMNQDGSNPFFNEFWSQKFQCDLPVGNTQYGKNCTGSEMLTSNDVSSLGMENVINVVFVYSMALSNLINKTCPDGKFCDAVADVVPGQWLQYLQDVNFTSPVGSQKPVWFDENGDGPALYAVYQLIQDSSEYKFKEVGEWTDDEGLFLNKSEITYVSQDDSMGDSSRCSQQSEFVIEALFDLRLLGCHTLNENRFNQLIGALFAIDKINNDSSILPGVHLSMTASDICGSSQNAGRVAFQSIKDWNFGGGFPRKSGETYLMGILHSGSSGKAMEESRTLQIVDVPLLSNSATSSALSDTEEFPNFLRTVPPDTKQALVMAEILVSLGIKYVHVIHSRGAYAEGGAQNFRDAAKKNGVCITNTVTLDSNTNYGTLLSDLMANPDARVLVLFLITRDGRGLFGEMVDRSVEPGRFQMIASDSWGTKASLIPGFERVAVGALTVTFKSSVIPAFEEFFLTMNPMNQDGSNPFFNEFWSQKFQCDLPVGNTQYGKNCTGSEMLTSNDVSSLGTENVINVVFVYSMALSNLINETCPDGKFCDAVADVVPGQWLQYLQDVNFTSPVGSQKPVWFDENGDGPALYAVYQLIQDSSEYKFKEVGEWTDDEGLFLNKSEITYVSQDDSMGDSSRCSQQSEFVIEALFDLRLLGCHTLNENRFNQLIGALFAIDKINNDSSILPGVHLSMTASDICGSSQNAGRVAFQSIKDWNFGGGFPRKSGETYLMGILHSGSSGKAMEESRTLQIVDVPLLSNSATSSALSDTEEFPNFLRTVPPDTKQALVMAEILVSLGIKYVHVIHSRGAYAEGGAQNFRDAAKKNGVCITNTVTLDSNTNYGTLLSDLMANPDARVLVLFLITRDGRGLFGEMVDRSVEPGRFQMIASDSWGTKASLIPGFERVAVGALTVTFKSSVIPAFEEFFLTMNPMNQDGSNPFFNEFWSQKFQCDLPVGNTQYGKNCTGSEMLTSNDVSSLGTENVINVVFVYSMALSNLINETCPDGKFCDAVADVVPGQWLQYLQDVNFTSPVGSQKPVWFDENGDGPALYAVYQLIQDSSEYKFKEVGEWTDDEGLFLNKSEITYVSQDDSMGDSSRCSQQSEFVIEALFALHGGDCTGISQSTVLESEAARFAVQVINQDPGLLPQVHLSLALTDICGTPEDAGRFAFQLTKGWDFDEGFPTSDESYLMGVLHTGSSGEAIEESRVLQIVDVPMISNTATSPALSNKEEFGNFLRTVPSDTKQAKLITEVLARHGLTYIQLVNSKGAYGEGGAMSIQEAGEKVGVCVANSYTVDSNTDYDALMGNLLAKSDARVLVLFLVKDHAVALFQEMVNRNVEPGYFQIVGSETWGTRPDFIPGLEAPAVGALTVFFKSSIIPMFQDYLLSRTPQDDASNPFFNEFWEEKFKCSLPGGSTKYSVQCTGSEVLSQSDVTSMSHEDLVNSVFVYATALSELINETCPDGKFCDAVADVVPREWFQHLQDVEFTSLFGSQKLVSFDENGDGPALFAVYQLTETSGMYSFIEVGTWDELNGLSNLTDGLIDPMLMSTCTGICAECNPEPTNDEHRNLRIPGDLDIPVVLQLSEPGKGLTCGPPLPDKALVIESLLYTLDQINNDSLILPGVQLGVTIVDSCGIPLIADRELVGVLGGFTRLESSGPTLALLGAVNRDVAEEVFEVVSNPSKTPLVSNSATGVEFDDAQDYPYVLHTSAPFSRQADAVAQILKKFSWRYVAVVYSSTPYGMENYEEFKGSSSVSMVCFAGEHQINDETDFAELIKELSRDSDLFVIVAFVEASHARKLLLADEFERSKRFLWVGTDTWDSPSVVTRLEEPASGMLLVTYRKPELPDLQDYFAQLDFKAANVRDPFLGEYLKRNYNCDPSATDCQFGEMVRNSIQEMSVEISSLVNALHVVAQGASWLHDDKCGSSTDGLCDAFLMADPEDLVTKMQQVTLKSGAGGEPFSFNERSAPADYNIKNYQYDGLSGQFVIAGDYYDGELTLEVANVNLHNPASDDFQKVPTGCTCMNPIPSYAFTNWVWSDHGLWAIIVLVVAGVFALVAFAVFILFVMKRFSYIVQSASFSLSLWLLFGIILMYLLNIVYLFDANPVICGIRRFGTSFVYCVVYSAMLAKSIRLNRFRRKDPGEDLNFAGSWSQTLLFLAFLLPEVFLVGEWLILVPVEALLSGNSEGGCGVTLLQPSCAFSSFDLTILMFYAYFLVLVTFLSSLGSVNAPNFQHEGTSLYLSSMFSCLILIAWTCVYNKAKPVYSEAAIPIGLTADATIILILMFNRKVWSLCQNKSESKEKKVEFKKHQEKKVLVYDNQEVQVDVASINEDENTHF